MMTSALMTCSPWAAVDADSARMLFSEEPAKHCRLQMELDLHKCSDEIADLRAENVVKAIL
jgi:hypothetical protein